MISTGSNGLPADSIIKPNSLLLLILLCMAFFATTAGARGGGGHSRTAQSVTVPLKFDGGFPVITVRINGHKVPMTIDLIQTAPLSLQQSAVDEVKAVVVADINTVSDATPASPPLIKVRRMEIGGMTFSNVDGYVDARAPQTLTPTTPQGVIGMGLLRSFKVILDYKHKSITFIQSSRSAADSDACTGTKVSFMPEWHGAPVAKAHTELGDLILAWDTGAARGVIRKQSADGLHATVTDRIVAVPRLMFGESDIGAMDFHVVDYAQVPGTDGFIGNDFFADHVVCIDFPGTRFLIRR